MVEFFDEHPVVKWTFFTIGVVGVALIAAGFVIGALEPTAATLASMITSGLIVLGALYYAMSQAHGRP